MCAKELLENMTKKKNQKNLDDEHWPIEAQLLD